MRAPHRSRPPRTSRRHTAIATPVSVDDKVLAVLRKRRKHGVRADDLVRAARLTPNEAAQLPDRIDHLLRTGALVERARGRLVLPTDAGLVSGRLHAHPDGYAFVVTDDPHEPDYYIPRSRVRPALHGDRVLALVTGSRRGRREARVADVLERGTVRLVGTYHAARHGGILVPREDRLTYGIRVPQGHTGGAAEGDLVVATITRYPDVEHDMEAEVAVVLGPASDPRVETAAVIHRYALPESFPEAVVEEAAALPRAVSAVDVSGRLDLRDLPLVTIDGENARDFDDAVAVEERGDGFRLWVSIADVAHYVAEGSRLDQEAAARGTSVYFPERVLPMLPEALSNGICSLNPHVDRLSRTVVLDFDRQGEIKHSEFHDSVMRSAARLTYTDLRRILVDQEDTSRRRYQRFIEMLESMQHLCGLLMQRRRARGSIDFDLPEAEVVLDLTGRPEMIARAERHIGHQIIEEFMLAANEAVARYFVRHKLPLLHRVHEPPDPDAVAELSRFLATFGVRLSVRPDGASPRDFQRVLETVVGRPEERLINTVLLRTMKQARYSPEPLGHFGLATETYTHFTSPIRRYPDLIVHRILAEVLTTGRLTPTRQAAWIQRLPAIAEDSSRSERIAMDAEREVVDLKKVEFMQDKIGAEFAGFVSGVQRFGFFVELTDYFVEGLVHVSTLDDDYDFVERAHLLRGHRTHRIFRLGDAVRVRVVAADPERRRIDFQVGSDERAVQPTNARRRRMQRRRRHA